MPIPERLLIDPVAKAEYKARLLQEANRGSQTFVRDTIRFTLSDIQVDGKGRLSVVVTASDSSGTLPIDNPYLFVNPPIMVPDGQGGYREDHKAALRTIVVEAVLGEAKRQGWLPRGEGF